MDQYAYLIERYSKKTRDQVSRRMMAFVVLLVGGLVVANIGETNPQRKARIQREQTYVVRAACELGPRACERAQEDAKKVICQLFPEECDR
jgi:hypothetical protein